MPGFTIYLCEARMHPSYSILAYDCYLYTCSTEAVVAVLQNTGQQHWVTAGKHKSNTAGQHMSNSSWLVCTAMQHAISLRPAQKDLQQLLQQISSSLTCS